MKRVFVWTGIFGANLMVCGFLLLFTAIGNKILTPFLQSVLNNTLPIQSQFSNLRIGFGKANAEIMVGKNIILHISGDYGFSTLDMQATITLIPDSSTADKETILANFTIHGKYSNYTIASVPKPTESKEQENPASLIMQAKMRFLTPKTFIVRGEQIPISVISGIFGLKYAPNGSLRFIAQKNAPNLPHNTLQIRAVMQNSMFEDMPLGFDISYQSNAESQAMVGSFSLNGTDFLLQGKSADNTWFDIGFITPQKESVALLKVPKTLLDSMMQAESAMYYNLHITNLALFGKAFALELLGKVDIEGEIRRNSNELMLYAQSESFGGLGTFTLQDNTLTFKGEQLSLSSILGTLKIQKTLEARLKIEGVYNLAFHKGTFDIQGNNIVFFIDAPETLGLEKFLGYDNSMQDSAQDSWGVGFENLLKENMTLQIKANIDHAQTDAQILLKSPTQTLHSHKCHIDLKAQTINLELLDPPLVFRGKFSDMQIQIPNNQNLNTTKPDQEIMGLDEILDFDNTQTPTRQTWFWEEPEFQEHQDEQTGMSEEKESDTQKIKDSNPTFDF